MRVLISGGGIAGLTLANMLHQHGIGSVVIEQASDLRQDGYAIDFFGTGYEVAERMGLIDRLFSQHIAFDGIEYVNAQGKLIAKLDAALLRKITEEKYMALMRWSLEEALYEALEGSVEVRFGRWCVSASPRVDAVEVTFNDGTSESFDLFIGADGVHSTTRALVFGPDEQFSRDLGYTIACYPLADRYDIGSTWKMYVEPGRLAATYCTCAEGELLTFFMYHSAKSKQPPRSMRLTHLQEVFAEMGWITQQLLADAPTSTQVFMDTLIQIQMPTWHQGRVALVGDACGCPTLLSGQGASLAMAGAYLLAEALHEAATYQEAFQRYEQQMRPLVLTQQKRAHGFATFFLPGTPLGLFLQQMLIKVLFRETFQAVLRREFSAPSLLRKQEASPEPTTGKLTHQ
jgi:2-polyprenyl-6-methoxyphenol hydroxylase-like FAD-dependent oxidoreductase